MKTMKLNLLVLSLVLSGCALGPAARAPDVAPPTTWARTTSRR